MTLLTLLLMSQRWHCWQRYFVTWLARALDVWLGLATRMNLPGHNCHRDLENTTSGCCICKQVHYKAATPFRVFASRKKKKKKHYWKPGKRERASKKINQLFCRLSLPAECVPHRLVCLQDWRQIFHWGTLFTKKDNHLQCISASIPQYMYMW